MKKKLFIITIILSLTLMTACNNNASQTEYNSLMAEKQSLEAELQKQKESEETTQQITQETTQQITQETTQQTAQETTHEVTTAEKVTETQAEMTQPVVNANDEVEIIAEYTLADGIGWYTRHFMVIRNNSDKTVDVSTSSKAYSSDGALVSVASAGFDALGAGCVSIFYEAFETDANISYYDTEITSKKSSWYESVIQDLSYKETLISNGVIYEVTNNGEYAAEFVEGTVLFFLNDELVEFDTMYFTDDDCEIKPGKTISEQFNSYKDFDRVEFYLSGIRDK